MQLRAANAGSTKPLPCKARACRRRAGLSLLEVLVALAIFFMSIVVISQMVDQASRTAQKAARLTKASLHAESVMAEVTAGIRPMAPSGQEPLPDSEDGWVVMVDAQPESWTQVPSGIGTGSGLHLVHVTVAWMNSAGAPETEFTLSRVLLDPALRQSPTFGVPGQPGGAAALPSGTSILGGGGSP